MEEWGRELANLCETGQRAAVVTIIWTKKRSSPWQAGRKMIVFPHGEVRGGLGGKYLDEVAKCEALKALAKGKPKEVALTLTHEIAGGEGKVCGGPLRLFIEIFPLERLEDRNAQAAFLSSLQTSESVVLATIVKGHEQDLGKKLAISPSGSYCGDLGCQKLNERLLNLVKYPTDFFELMSNKSVQLCGEEVEFLLEKKIQHNELIILGAGDLSQYLTMMAKLLGFRVLVVDDDPRFVNESRFPQADQILCTEFLSYIARREGQDPNYYVIATRGHRHDQACLERVLMKKRNYVGVIGNQRRISAMMADLANLGIPAAELAKVYAPIGIGLQAESLEEIALSIMAQIVQVKNQVSR